MVKRRPQSEAERKENQRLWRNRVVEDKKSDYVSRTMDTYVFKGITLAGKDPRQ